MTLDNEQKKETENHSEKNNKSTIPKDYFSLHN